MDEPIVDVFVLQEGAVIVQHPKLMSQDSFDDFEQYLQLVIRKVKRSIKTESPSKGVTDERAT